MKKLMILIAASIGLTTLLISHNTFADEPPARCVPIAGGGGIVGGGIQSELIGGIVGQTPASGCSDTWGQAFCAWNETCIPNPSNSNDSCTIYKLTVRCPAGTRKWGRLGTGRSSPGQRASQDWAYFCVKTN